MTKRGNFYDGETIFHHLLIYNRCILYNKIKKYFRRFLSFSIAPVLYNLFEGKIDYFFIPQRKKKYSLYCS